MSAARSRTFSILRPWLFPLAAVILATMPWWAANPSLTRQIALIAIASLVVSGLNLSFGYAGELALGQGAVYAVGAYTAGYLSVSHGVTLLPAMLASAVAALILGVLSGAPGLRLGGWSLAITSFFLILLIPDVLSITEAQTGGFSGLPSILPPTIFGHILTTEQYYAFIVLVAAVWFVFLRNVVLSSHGSALKVIRDSPVLASALGISVYRTKLIAYAVGAIPAGIAGALFAHLDQFISPSSFTFIVAVGFFAASIIGGAASVYGAIVGAALLQLGPLRSTDFQQYSMAVYGLFLLVAGVLLSGGLSAVGRGVLSRLRPASAATRQHSPQIRADLPVCLGQPLEVTSVSKAFGGTQALSNVSWTASPGKVSAVIGPNGSGKTTLLNLVSGYYRPDTGEVTLNGVKMSGNKPYAIARRGVARTFQTPQVPLSMTTREVVITGSYISTKVPWVATALRLPVARRNERKAIERANNILSALGLHHLADVEASTLPLGTRRVLELARAVASEPAVLLLDEVASGLDENEIEQLVEAIDRLRTGGATIVLVEHNFPLVLRLADEIVVLAQGQVVTSSSPDMIAKDPQVLSLYLGVSQDSTVESVMTEVQP